MPAGEPKTSFRPRSEYLGHLAVGSGDGAVLIEPAVAGELRVAAARAGGRPTAGLLYGRSWHDGEGGYTLVDGFVPAGSAGIPAGEADPAAARARLREEAARSYPDAQEVGWWRTAPRPGEDGWPDPGAWPLGERPDGVGLVVFADGTPPATAVLAPRNVVQGSVLPYSTVKDSTAQDSTVKDSTVKDSTAQDSAAPAEPDLTRREQASRSGVRSWDLVPHTELSSRRRVQSQPGAPRLEARHYVLVTAIVLVLIVVIAVAVLVSSALH